MIRKHKKYTRPKHAFDAERIKDENVIVKKYGLKNKTEVWKAKAKLDDIRRQAKKLVYGEEEEKARFLEKLSKIGLKVENVADVLAFTEEDILNRRLQTIVMKKGLATTPKGARQLITHKHILIDNKIINIPSYQVSVEEEGKINVKLKEKKKEESKPKEKVREVKEDKPEKNSEVEPKVEEKKEEVKE